MLRTPREPLHYWAALERVMTADEQLRRRQPPANPHNVFGSAGAGEDAPASLAAHVAPVLRSR